MNGFDVFNIERYSRRISNGLSIFCAAAVVVALDVVMIEWMMVIMVVLVESK